MSRFATSVSFLPRALTTTLAACAIATSLLGSPVTAAAAQPAADVPQITVPYSLRDLASDHGTHVLYQRIVNAARTVCPAGDSRDLDAFAASRTCQRQAVARAVAQVGSARLAALQARASMRHG